MQNLLLYVLANMYIRTEDVDDDDSREATIPHKTSSLIDKTNQIKTKLKANRLEIAMDNSFGVQ
jgi:hypothetical protein